MKIWIWATPDSNSPVPAFAQLTYHHATGAIKKPDSKENLASEEGDEKLFIGLRKGSDHFRNDPLLNIVGSNGKSLAKTGNTGEIMLFLPNFKG